MAGAVAFWLLLGILARLGFFCYMRAVRSLLNAALILALSVFEFVPFGAHVLTHALELAHQHGHDGVAEDHDGGSHGHELQPAPECARIAASGVRLPAPALSSFLSAAASGPTGASAVASTLLARGLDPPGVPPSPQSAASRAGPRAPPAA